MPTPSRPPRRVPRPAAAAGGTERLLRRIAHQGLAHVAPEVVRCVLRRGSTGAVKAIGGGNQKRRAVFFRSTVHFANDARSARPLGRFSYLVAQNFLHEEFVSFPGPKVFFSTEPWHTLSAETRANLESGQFDRHLYSYAEGDVDRRMFFTAIPHRRGRLLDRRTKCLEQARPHLCCIVNRWDEGSKLVDARVELVRALADEVHVFGRKPFGGRNGWKAFPNYYGEVEDKRRTVERYTFVIAFENSDYPGYVSEKLLESLLAGAVPLYWGGGGHVDDVIPSDAYVDCRDRDAREIAQLVRSMRHEEIVGYRRAGLGFLSSPQADRFTRRYRAEAIIRRLAEQEAESTVSRK